MDFKTFYIKHLTNPVGVKTHVYNPNTSKWTQTAFTVGDLIEEFQKKMGSKLANVDAGLITLQYVENEREFTLRPGFPLAELNHGLTDDNPLVIRSETDTLTIDEYMCCTLPNPVYKVVSWIDANHQQHSTRIEKPRFVPRIICEEVQTLQPFIKDNLLDVSAKCLIPQTDFTAIRETNSCVGEPDHLMTRAGEIVAIVEEKGKWTLPDGDLVGGYSLHAARASAVNQLYHYMRLNHRKHGIITSYDNTWFVYRYVNLGCSACDELSTHETLYISDGISYNAQTPTVLQCISYFNSIIDSTHMDSPPPSKPATRANSASKIARPISPRVSQLTSSIGGKSPFSSEGQINEKAQEFDVDDFQFSTVIGEARSKVYLDIYGYQTVALKVADIAKHPEMLSELQNEVFVYQQLSGLQGDGIPRFVCHGYIEHILYCVGVSICGTVAKIYTEQQKLKLLDTLDKIHAVGILHNDIKKENILIDESGNPFIIDFGFSSQNCDLAVQMEERQALLDECQLVGHLHLEADISSCHYLVVDGQVTDNMMGAFVVPGTVLTDPVDSKPKLFFVYDDIGIRYAGEYRFQCTIINMQNLTTTVLNTGSFPVVRRREFRTPTERSFLEQSFQIQGVYDKNSKKYKKNLAIEEKSG
ncbi:hypothetical protein HDV01_002520 [Terramyces sp. JEL0728]|nr:hypothetical protein HDV01_002520 [Terramyces sp. JEL0728]